MQGRNSGAEDGLAGTARKGSVGRAERMAVTRALPHVKQPVGSSRSAQGGRRGAQRSPRGQDGKARGRRPAEGTCVCIQLVHSAVQQKRVQH